MFSSILSILLLVSLPAAIFAQDISGLPPCAAKCLQTAYASANKSCAQTDFVCLCKNSDFVSSSASCYAKSCPASDLVAAQAWGVRSCAAAGVTIAANSINSTLTGNNTSTNNTSTPTASTTNTPPISTNPASTNANSAGHSTTVGASHLVHEAFVIGLSLISATVLSS